MGAGDTVHLSAEDITVNGTLLAANLNAGTLTVPEGGTITVARDMTVRESLLNLGTIVYNGGQYDQMAFAGSISNSGSIVNKGIAFYESEAPFVVSGFDNTSGKLYSYCPLDGLVNVIVKRDISYPEVMWLSYQTTPYNAEEQKPYIRRNPDLGILYINQYRVTYLRDGAVTEDVKSVGTVTVKIEINSRTENAFRGTALLDYEITRSETTVIKNDALIAAAKDPNYYRVKLGCDLEPGSVIVTEGVELDLNGYCLRVFGITNYGRLVIPANGFAEGYVPVREDCNVIFSRIDNYGQIENDGLMASNEGTRNSTFTNNDGSEFINNGSVTVNYSMIESTRLNMSGTGTLTGRRYYEDLAFALTETEFYYDETAKEPDFTVTLKKDGSPVDKSIFTRQYVDNLDAGTGKLFLYDDNADIYSEFYITYSIAHNNSPLTFTIYRSEIEVLTSEELLNAAADANYERITLKGNIALGSNVLTLNENVILDCGSYLLTTDGTAAPSVPATSAITAEVSDIDSFNAMKYVATDVKLLSDIGNNTETVAFDAVGYSVDLDVDLNGYDLRAAVAAGGSFASDNLTVRVRFYDGSGSKTAKISGTVVADDTASYAVTTLSADRKSATYLEFEGITVYGMYLKSAEDSSKSVTVIVSECTVIGKNDVSYAVRTVGNSFGLSAEFVSSTIEGSSAVYLGYREKSILFTDCTISGLGTYKAPEYGKVGKGFAIGVFFYRTNNHIFESCNISSVNGYAVVQVSGTDGIGACKLYLNGCTLSGAAGQYYAYDANAVYINGAAVPLSKFLD